MAHLGLLRGQCHAHIPVPRLPPRGEQYPRCLLLGRVPEPMQVQRSLALSRGPSGLVCGWVECQCGQGSMCLSCVSCMNRWACRLWYSNHGQCVQGICHCMPPYASPDCSELGYSLQLNGSNFNFSCCFFPSAPSAFQSRIFPWHQVRGQQGPRASVHSVLGPAQRLSLPPRSACRCSDLATCACACACTGAGAGAGGARLGGDQAPAGHGAPVDGRRRLSGRQVVPGGRAADAGCARVCTAPPRSVLAGFASGVESIDLGWHPPVAQAGIAVCVGLALQVQCTEHV